MYEIFGVKEYDRWGALIKTWATGKDYITPAIAGQYPTHGQLQDAKAPFNALPNSVESFKAVLAKAGITIDNPDRLSTISFIKLESDGSLVVRLPTVEMIKGAEAALLANPPYGLPGFYSAMFKDNPAEKPKDPQGMMMDHASRIGDYTLSVCM
jgi:hypothetical protein